MQYIYSLAIVMGFLMIGEWVSTKSKAYIPSVFVTAVLFLVGFWTFVPKNVVPTASFGTEFIGITQAMLLIHMGSLMSLKTLLKQWKAVAIALAGVVGTVLFAMGIGLLLFDWHTVIASVPPLTGGLVAAFLMTDGLKEQGITNMVAFPVAMFVIHSMIGYPITSFMLKRESTRLLKKFDPKVAHAAKTQEVEEESKHWIKLPNAYCTSAYMIFKVAILTFLAEWIASLMNGVVNQYIICLIVGVIAHQFGLTEEGILQKAGVFNWLMYGLLAYIFANLNVVKPNMLLGIVIPIVTMIILGIFGMFLASWILAKPLGFSREMAFASAMTALFGFPADYVVTNEVAEIMSSNENEKKYLLDNMLPKMLVGGFATVSVASVIIASIFLKLL